MLFCLSETRRITVGDFKALIQSRPMRLSGDQLQRKIEIADETGAIDADVFNNEFIDRTTSLFVRPLVNVCAEFIQQLEDTLGWRPTVWRNQILIMSLVHALPQHLAKHPVHADAERPIYRRSINAKAHCRRPVGRLQRTVQGDNAVVFYDSRQFESNFLILVQPTGNGIQIHERTSPQKKTLIELFRRAPALEAVEP